MRHGKDLARGLGAGLLAVPAAIAVMGGYEASGGMHGWNEFLIRAPHQAFEGDALRWWLAAVACSMFCELVLRAGIVGVLGIVMAMAGAGPAVLVGLRMASHGNGNLLWLVIGVAVWVLGITVMTRARLAVVAKHESVVERVERGR